MDGILGECCWLDPGWGGEGERLGLDAKFREMESRVTGRLLSGLIGILYTRGCVELSKEIDMVLVYDEIGADTRAISRPRRAPEISRDEISIRAYLGRRVTATSDTADAILSLASLSTHGDTCCVDVGQRVRVQYARMHERMGERQGQG
jgi:hypothetical protein